MSYILTVILVIAIILLVIYSISFLNDKIFQPTIIDQDEKYNYEEVNIKVRKDANINGILIRPKDNKPLIVYFHGNTGSIKNRNYIIDTCIDLDIGLFLIDYRGYGKSTGTPCTKLIKYDALMCYDYINKIYDESRINVWGESIGGGPAAYVAMKRNPRSLMLLATYSSLDKVLVTMECKYPLVFRLLAANLVVNAMDNLPTESWLKDIKCPVIIVHSEDDELIRINHAKRNVEQLKFHNKEYTFIKIKGNHSSPDIEVSQMKLLLKKSGIDYSKMTSKSLNKICKRLKNAGKEEF